MRTVRIYLFLTVGYVWCYAQDVRPPAPRSQSPATADELKFFRFMLTNLASLDHSPDAAVNYANMLFSQFGLSQQEWVAIRSAAQRLRPFFQQLRQSSNTIVAGKIILSAEDTAALANLQAQRDQMISTLANQILNSVSPGTAARLRMPGHIVANVVKSNGGN
jgi:hypothetical protein